MHKLAATSSLRGLSTRGLCPSRPSWVGRYLWMMGPFCCLSKMWARMRWSGTMTTQTTSSPTQPPALCSVSDCDKPVHVRGWCSTHYWRWYRHGDPNTEPPRPQTFDEYLASSVDVGDCWLWTRSIKANGYGGAAFAGKHHNAHLLVWRQLVGAIPDGLQLDHLCRVRHCVNPDHLEPVTPKVNAERGSKATKRWCIRGHDLWDEANTRIRPNGTRACRKCRALAEAARRERLRAAQVGACQPGRREGVRLHHRPA